MDHAAGAAAWERQHSERVARTTQRRFALAEGVRRVFVQRLGVLSLDEAFSAMDLNKDGVLSVGEFKKGLRALKIGLMPWEVSEFVSVIDSDMSGTIDRQEFVEMFGHSVSLPPTAAASAATTGGQPDAGAPTALPGAKRGSSGGGVFDSELSGRLDELEAQSAGVIDPDAYGFYTRADAMEDESRLLLARARWLTRHVCKELAKQGLSLSAAFARFDRRGTGRLTAASLLRGLSSLGIAVDSLAFDVLMVAFQTDRHGGGFTEREFLTHFEQISEAEITAGADAAVAAADAKRDAKAGKKSGAEGALDQLREQEERDQQDHQKEEQKKEQKQRDDGLPERKRRADGTPTTELKAAQPAGGGGDVARSLDLGSQEGFKKAALEDLASKSLDSALAMVVEDGGGEDDDEDDDDDDEPEAEEEAEATDVVACAGRRLALDLPRPSGAAAHRPSLLLRIPYSALLAVWQQLPRKERATLCATCGELRSLLGRAPGGQWETEGSVLRRLVFDNWSVSFFAERGLGRQRTQRQKQREDQEKADLAASSAIAGADESVGVDDGGVLDDGGPTLEDMLRQIGGAAAAGQGQESAGADDSSKVMDDDSFDGLVQYLQLRRLTVAPCADAKAAAWRRDAVRAERLVYSSARRRAWRPYTFKQLGGRGKSQERVVRQQFDRQTGRYRGAMEVVPRVRWHEAITVAHAAAMADALPMQKQLAATDDDGEAAGGEADADTAPAQQQQQPVIVIEGVTIPTEALQRRFQHDLNIENIPSTALAQWLTLLPPRTDLIPPEVAIGGSSGGDDLSISVDGGSDDDGGDISIDGDSIDGAESIEIDEEPAGQVGGSFSLLLTDGGPSSAAGCGQWALLCRVVSALSALELMRLGASCKLFRTPALGRYTTRTVAPSRGVGATETQAAVECSRTVGCKCLQCGTSVAAVVETVGAFTLPEYVAWHRVCDALARKGGVALRGNHRNQIEGMAMLAQAKPASLSWAGLLHKGVNPWVKHVKRQMALLESKLLVTVEKPSRAKLEGDRMMKAGDYAGAAEAYATATKQRASKRRSGGGKPGRGLSEAFSRVPIGGR